MKTLNPVVLKTYRFNCQSNPHSTGHNLTTTPTHWESGIPLGPSHGRVHWAPINSIRNNAPALAELEFVYMWMFPLVECCRMRSREEEEIKQPHLAGLGTLKKQKNLENETVEHVPLFSI